MKLFSKRVLTRILIALGVLVFAAAAVDGALAWHSQHRLAAKVEELHAAGEPATLADLAPQAVAPENNPAAFLERMMPALKAFAKDELEFEKSPVGIDPKNRERDITDAPTPEEIGAWRGIVAKYPEIVPLLEQASQCTAYASPADFSLPSLKLNEQMIEQVQPFRSLMNFVEDKMLVLLADKKPDEAAKLGIAFLRFNELRKEPFIFSYMVTVAMQEETLRVLNFVLRDESLSAQSRTDVERELALLDNLSSFQRALSTERVFVLAQIDNPEGKVLPIVFSWPLQNSRLDQADLLDRDCEAAKLPLDQIRQRYASELKRVPGWANQLTLEQLIGTEFDSELRRLTELRCLRVLNALEGYRRQTGNDAERIGQLSLPPEARIDPYSGKPLVVKKLPDGWLVYSVYRNGLDDGGRFNFNSGDWGYGPPGYPLERDPLPPPEKKHS